MADTLKTRVSRVIAGGVHALLDRVEDQAPEALMAQCIREADAVVDDVRHELGRVSANRHLSQQRHAQLNGHHSVLATQIDEALNQGRDDLVRAAVARQLDIEAQLPVLEATLGEQTRQEAELRGFVAALLAQRREMETALAEFRRSRATPAGGGRGTAQHAGGPRIDPVTGAFDRLYERQTGLAGTGGAVDPQQVVLLRELDELVRNSKIAERLAQLKAGRGERP